MHARQAKVPPGLADTWGWLLLTLVVSVPSAHGQSLPPGRAIPLAVHEGRCQCILPTPKPDDKFFLILGSASFGAGPYQVNIQTEGTEAPVSIPVDKSPSEGVRSRPPSKMEDASRSHSITISESDYAPAQEPPRTRNFFLFVKERDFYNPESYITVPGELQGLGRHCQVYVDRDFGERSRLQPTVEDILHTFDEEVYPRACRTLGRAIDVDRDGRFTILLTPWLGKLADGKVSLGGFVRGSDFFRDLAPPFGNRCDMMYLNADLQPGSALRTILAHEYTHAVIFSEHIFGGYQPQAPRQDEEGWLNEGLAHVVEDGHGYSWSNLDYRISAFLSAPERYQLVVPDYFSAGLFRSHGHRGAAYLFLRWCCDCYGDDLLKQLVQTNLTGTSNLEAATHEQFDDLFRRWTIALSLSGTRLADERMQVMHRVDLHQPLGGRLLCGPHFEELGLCGSKPELHLPGTSAAFLLLHSPAKTASRVTITADPESHLQVTLIRLPEGTGRLSLRVEPPEASGLGNTTLRLVVTAHDQDVMLEHAAWERRIPTANRPEDTSFPAAESNPLGDREMLRNWFGDPRLKAGETRTSAAITIPPCLESGESWVFKISAADAAGHHLSTWAVK